MSFKNVVENPTCVCARVQGATVVLVGVSVTHLLCLGKTSGSSFPTGWFDE